MNDEVATLGRRVDPESDVIRVDDRRIRTGTRKKYLVLNKPKGVITTLSDPEGRQAVSDLVREPERLFPVGRLDRDTEGLLLMTNDGDVAHRLTHPSFGIEKTYVAKVEGTVTPATLKQMQAGVHVDEGRPAKAVRTRLIGTSARRGESSVVEVVIHEGRKHVVRLMLEEVGHPVIHLTRTAIGPLKLGRLKPGEQRELSQAEVARLYEALGL